MASHNRSRTVSALSLLVVVAMLAGCGATATPATAPTAAPTLAATKVPPTATPKGPQVGGKLVMVMNGDPDSLDPSNYGWGSGNFGGFFGSRLVSKDPETKEYVPYLAKSWTVSPDGLTWDFVLRKDVKFHNGTPMTAKDYAWTVNRTRAGKGVCGGWVFPNLEGAEAVDDFTLRLRFKAPNSFFLGNLSLPWCGQPMSQAYVEQVGDAVVGQKPVGVGPFVVTDWATGSHVSLVRNPDFVWGPPYTHGGPPYIERLEFRVISEFERATRLAGLEAGELDSTPLLDTEFFRVSALPNIEVVRRLQVGAGYRVNMNLTKPLFDDIRVRRAFNMIFDREKLIKVLAPAGGQPLYGPMTPATDGYCADVEAMGYRFDLAKAKALLAEAGYTPGTDGMLQKDGKPLEIELKAYPYVERLAVPVQEQLKAAGVQTRIQMQEQGIWEVDIAEGKFDLTVSTYLVPNEYVLVQNWSSANTGIGGGNKSLASDPELDKMLKAMSATSDVRARRQAACEVQKYIVQQAYIVPLFASYNDLAVNKRVKGLVMGYFFNVIELYDAYIEQ